MPFPQGGDFTRDVSNDFTVVSSDRRICRFDNGTDVCDAGHKLKFPGTCFNQVVGTFNSTDPTFQPTFPICVSDYESSGFNNGLLVSSAAIEGGSFLQKYDSESEIDFHILAKDNEFSYIHKLLIENDIKSGFYSIAKVDASISREFFLAKVSPIISTFWKMVHFNPGVLPHLPGVTSDLFAYDVFSSVFIIKRAVAFFLDVPSLPIKKVGDIFSSGNVISTDRLATGEEELCIGDETPPFITYISPTTSGTHVRPRDQIIDFSLTDAVGEVDLSSVYINLTSTTTSGTIPLVVAGADQTGGNVTVIGDPSSFRFIYNPPFLWEYNDIVVVSISGSDSLPLVEGELFFCEDSDPNHFVGDITFQVLNEEDLGASLTAIGDIEPPYVSLSIPASGTLDNNVFTTVSISIADDLTGVDLETIEISVDGTPIVIAGEPETSETVILGTSNEYTIIYTPDTPFEYGSTSFVNISAADRVTIASPNVLLTSYSFSFIEDSTLVIDNFLPAVGTTTNLESVDIEVDVYDNTYSVNIDQTFMVINGITVPATKTPIASGVHLSYHPPNNYEYDEPIRVIIHGTNGNNLAPAVKEELFRLFFGCRVLFFNRPPNFQHDEQINVFVSAKNLEINNKNLSTGYFFTTYTQPSVNLGAEITAINPSSNLGATITSVGPYHAYGKTVTVEFTVADFDGHILGPYTFSYTIEEN